MAIRQDNATFVASDCIPTGIVIKKARSMSSEHVRKLLKHIYKWQGKHGPENAFQICIYIKEQLSACYPLPNNRQEKQSPEETQKKDKQERKMESS